MCRLGAVCVCVCVCVCVRFLSSVELCDVLSVVGGRLWGRVQERERMITECSYTFDSEVWSGVSDTAKSFVAGLLQAEPHQRCVCLGLGFP